MGLDSRKPPPLPAPTETDATTPTELTADMSRAGDEKSTYSLPDDGTPVTIRTRTHRAKRSQTSLLIEYFEGSKSATSGPSRKPSVRVRLTPSKKGGRGDHIQVTETKTSRRPSVSKKLTIGDAEYPAESEDTHSITSYASATEESSVSRNPIDIEIDRSHRRRRPASPLIPDDGRDSYVAGSDISAIPTDSFLDAANHVADLKRSASPDRPESLDDADYRSTKDRASAKHHRHKTSASAAAAAASSRDKSESRKRRSKSRTSSVSEPSPEEAKEATQGSRRRSSRNYPPESQVSAVDCSVVSSSTAPGHRSMDARSMRSNVSKSSINNPKLLETVEDAIRRLILPELSALKREQSQRESRRESLASTGTSLSRDVSADRRRSAFSRAAEPAKDADKPKERRNREARHDYDDLSVHSASLDSTVEGEYAPLEAEHTPKRSIVSSGRVNAAAAAAAPVPPSPRQPLAPADDPSEVGEHKQRERRRKKTEAARSRVQGQQSYADEYDDDEPAPTPPMPLMSEINPSELTRTSILSVESERPLSASEEMSSVNGTGGLASTLSDTPIDFQHTLGTSHANVSHGDLTALPRGKKEYVGAREYESDEFGQKIPVGQQYIHYEEDNSRDMAEHGDYHDEYEDPYYSQQDVPPPLKYVPYQAGTRGLSPIPSVSGFTEAESDAPLPGNTRSLASGSEAYSPVKSPEQRQSHRSRSMQSLDSASNLQSQDYDLHPPAQSKRDSVYSDDSRRHTPLAAGKPVRGIGANVRIINPPFGAESAVASLIDGSVLDQSVLTAGSGYDYMNARESSMSYDDQSRASRNIRPERGYPATHHEVEEVEDEEHEEHEEEKGPAASSAATSHEYTEYELDEHGRKIAIGRSSTYRESPTASEAAITAGAVGAAAAALRAAQEKKKMQTATAEEDAEDAEEDFEPAGVNRNKSFKERAMEGWQPRDTLAHSMDRLDYEPSSQMSASGVPDMGYPMPEIGYLDDDVRTNPSFVQDDLDEEPLPGQWSGKATPTEYGQVLPREDEAKDSGLELTGSVDGAGSALTGAHGHAPGQDHDEWQRTSEDRKRDTLLTNPYEDASPIVNPALNENLLAGRGLGADFQAPYHAGSPGFMKYDEGYISNGPNHTPEIDPQGKAIRSGGMPGASDPYLTSNAPVRQMSGMSQGMASPFFDGATGAGLERIENKDIVALMQHLMVRDAQRSARDTEIVALLMNAALEMRNSFREMKELVQDTSDDVIYAGVENTEKIQKAINGPRPYPGTATANSRSLHGSSIAGTIEEVNAKKKNLWKRALQGLSARGTSDLSRIEDMLMQLLGEVDVLKTQTARPVSTSGQGQSFDNLQADMQFEQDKGYEPEGNSSISHASQSGHLNLPPSQGLQGLQGRQGGHERRVSDHRVSTVAENEEEYEYDHPTPSAERTNPHMLSPGLQDHHVIQRGGSAPPETVAGGADSNAEPPLSAGNTPRIEKGKKHKSSGSGSSWFPKISRWSGTTASSVGKALRGGKTKDAKFEDLPPSRSESSMASQEEYPHHPYGEDGKSEPHFSDHQQQQQQQAVSRQMSEMPIPAIPSHMVPEDPKYKAHRNSLNLQHPQPRTGPTDRYRTALEHSAQEYDVPGTPRSAEWEGSVPSLARLQSIGGESSKMNQGSEYWQESSVQSGSRGKPAKEPLERSGSASPSGPHRMSSVQREPSQGGGYEGAATAARVTNKNLNNALGVPARRPSGPRAMTPKSEEEAGRERRRKRDTFGGVVSQDASP